MKFFAFSMRKRVAVRLCASAVAVFAASPVLAQSQAVATLGEVVVTATRVEQSLTKVLADVTVIDADVIERSGAVSLADVLVHVPGIEMVRNGGPLGTTSLFLRGGNTNHTVVMIDGIRLDTQNGAGGATCQSIPAQQIERIEILRGPAAAIYGSDAIAGVIQVFTKNSKSGVQPSVGLGVGTYGTRTATAGLLGGHEGWRYALSLVRETSDGYNIQPAANPDNDGYTRDTATLRLGRDLVAGHKLEGTWVYTDADAGYDSTTAKTNVNYAKDNRTVQKLNALGLNWNVRWSDVWSSTVGVTQALDHYQTLPSPGAVPSYDTKTTIQTALWNNTLRWRDALWTVGLEGRRDALTNSGTTPKDTKRDQNAVALGYSTQFDAHSWQANARLDRDSDFGDHTTETLAYGYEWSPQWRLSASMGTGFRSPTLYQRFSDYGFAGLKPEESFSRELGVTYRHEAQTLSVVAYHNQITNLIAFGAAGACVSSFGCYANTSKATLQGVTLAGETRWGSVFWRASLDLQDPVDSENGNRLARRAQTVVKLGAETAWQGWDWKADVLLSGDRFDDAANKTLLPGYGLLNVGASRSIARQTELLVRLDNVGDKAYETAKGYANPGRSLFVGVKWTGL
jgi:vitamin B12 transporter